MTMAKRTATRELTDRNWDDEEEPEEAGEFIQASEDVIKNRQIKKAKRRGVTGGSEEGASVFSGFGGFKSASASSTSFSGFAEKAKNGSKTDSNNSSKTENGKTETKSESDFLMNLKSLNESVVTWIKQHVDKNPFCILTPIFKDYEKHLGELEKEKKCDTTKSSSGGDKSEEKGKEPLTFGKPEGGFKFPSNGAGSSATQPLSFGSFSSTTTSSFGGTLSGNGGFSFKTASSENKSGFSFGSLQSTNSTQSEATAGGEEEEYVPPAVEVSEVKEDGAYYTKRCKLFYQKDEKWVERGVGNLHLKLVNEKVQLIIRADTNLGNIMLNIMMTDGIPVKKQGKNNVFFVCIPNPPFDPKADETKPVPILLRVKTSEDAEELVAKIEEKRK